MPDEHQKTDSPRVVRFKLGDMRGQDDNPKNHDINAIMRSLSEYGYVEMIAYDTRTKRIVAGHGRVEALCRLRDAATCIWCDQDIASGDNRCGACKQMRLPRNVLRVDGDWEIEVVAHRFRSKAQARSYVVTANRTSELGGWSNEYGQYLAQFKKDDQLIEAMAFDAEAYQRAVSPYIGNTTHVSGHERSTSGVGSGEVDGVRQIGRSLAPKLLPPFPYFGGKRSVVGYVWQRLGKVKQYLEPFCGGAAMLLGADEPAAQETICDQNLYLVNFWRALKTQPDEITEACDYPVVHLELIARHRWLRQPERVRELREKLMDPEWEGDAQLAGWWIWGQCATIGNAWCREHWEGVPDSSTHRGINGASLQGAVVSDEVPFHGYRGMGINNSVGRRGDEEYDEKPASSDRGMGVHSPVTSVQDWMRRLSQRLRRVVVINGDWSRCLNSHYGRGTGGVTAVFLDPPYKSYEEVYKDRPQIAADVEAWCREQTNEPGLRIALCGHLGDYDLPGWDVVAWSRGSNTYGSDKTKNSEAIYFSPGCLPHPEVDVSERQ